MTNSYDVFLSYSHNDRDAAAHLHGQLGKLGLSVFWDEKGIRAGDLWLDALQDAVDGCGAFVVLVGRDGVGRWIGAETKVALNRYFGPRDGAERLPIFPILLGDTEPDTLPAFLRLFQATAWNGADALPDALFEEIRDRKIVPNTNDHNRRLSVRRAQRLSDPSGAPVLRPAKGNVGRARLLRHARAAARPCGGWR